MNLHKSIATAFLASVFSIQPTMAAEKEIISTPALEGLRALCVDPEPSPKLRDMLKESAELCIKNKKLFEAMNPGKNYFTTPVITSPAKPKLMI